MKTWLLEKDVQIAASHHLRGYDGKCKNVHGHNWKVTIYCEGSELDERGILIDFNDIKNLCNELDHKNLNKIAPFNKINPTAENLAKFLYEQIPYCCKVMVEEAVGSRVYYMEDEL